MRPRRPLRRTPLHTTQISRGVDLADRRLVATLSPHTTLRFLPCYTSSAHDDPFRPLDLLAITSRIWLRIGAETKHDFLTNFLHTPKGPGHPGQICWTSQGQMRPHTSFFHRPLVQSAVLCGSACPLGGSPTRGAAARHPRRHGSGYLRGQVLQHYKDCF